jgi:hypothetical protein
MTQLWPALIVSAALWTGTAHAAGLDAYTAQRGKSAAITMQSYAQLETNITNRTGQTVELLGTVSGTFSNGDLAGFMLRIDGGQPVIVTLPAADADIVIGARLRVLARIPEAGVVLDGLIVTRQTDAAAQACAPPPPVPEVYYKPPERLKESPTTYSAVLAAQPEVVAIYAERIKSYNGRLNDAQAQKIAYCLLDKSDRYGVDPRFVFALVLQESRFNPTAVSRSGAQGLGQLMPGTAAGLGVKDSFDIEQNLDGSVRYISDQLRTFGRYSLALAAYNAGPNAVRKYNGVPPYRETQNYVSIVWRTYAKLAGLDPDTGQVIASR